MHLLKIKHLDIIKKSLVLEIRWTIISSKKYQQHLIQDATLFFSFLRFGSADFRSYLPGAFSGIEGIIVLKDSIAMASTDDDFSAIGDHVMKGSGIRKSFFNGYVMKFMDVNFGKCINEFLPHFTFISNSVPPKM